MQAAPQAAMAVRQQQQGFAHIRRGSSAIAASPTNRRRSVEHARRNSGVVPYITAMALQGGPITAGRRSSIATPKRRGSVAGGGRRGSAASPNRRGSYLSPGNRGANRTSPTRRASSYSPRQRRHSTPTTDVVPMAGSSISPRMAYAHVPHSRDKQQQRGGAHGGHGYLHAQAGQHGGVHGHQGHGAVGHGHRDHHQYHMLHKPHPSAHHLHTNGAMSVLPRLMSRGNLGKLAIHAGNWKGREAVRTASQRRLRSALAEVGQSIRDLRMLHHHQHTLADHQEAVIDEIQAEGIDPGPPIEVPFLPPRGTLCARLFMLLDDPTCCQLSRYISIGILCTICVAALSFVVESLPRFRKPVDRGQDQLAAFYWVELISIIIFTVEYIGRMLTVWSVPAVYLDPKERLVVWEQNFMAEMEETSGSERELAQEQLTTEEMRRSAIEHEQKTSACRKVWLFLKAPANLLDLSAILPFYLEKLFASVVPGLAVMRTLRLTRVFRVFKIGKYSSSVRLLSRVLSTSMQALYLMLFFVILGMVVFGTIIFYCESGTYDPVTDTYQRPTVVGDSTEESPFDSIIQSFYWVLITATTVGFGDLVPTTIAGKITTSILTHFGILALALPITVIGANFAVEYSLDEPMVDDQYLEEELDIIEAHRLKQLQFPAQGPAVTPTPSSQADKDTSGDEAGAQRKPPRPPPSVITHLEVDSKDVFGDGDATHAPHQPVGTATRGQAPPPDGARDAPVTSSTKQEAPVESTRDVGGRVSPDAVAELANDMHMLVQDCSSMQSRARALAARLDDLQRRMATRGTHRQESQPSLVGSDMSLGINHPAPVIQISATPLAMDGLLA